MEFSAGFLSFQRKKVLSLPSTLLPWNVPRMPLFLPSPKILRNFYLEQTSDLENSLDYLLRNYCS